MASINIYVPDHMKRRMQQVRHVSWSLIAQEAFENVLSIQGVPYCDKSFESNKGEAK